MMLYRLLVFFAYVGNSFCVPATDKKPPVRQVNSIDHNFGPSDQLCGALWANEALRTHFVMDPAPPTYVCKNNGGVRYRCSTCTTRTDFLNHAPKGHPYLDGLSTGTLNNCYATLDDGKKIDVGSSKCLAYSNDYSDKSTTKTQCLSPSLALLECSNPASYFFDYMYCQDCLLYGEDLYDSGEIFRQRFPRNGKPLPKSEPPKKDDPTKQDKPKVGNKPPQEKGKPHP